jgi:hypothetical protein
VAAALECYRADAFLSRSKIAEIVPFNSVDSCQLGLLPGINTRISNFSRCQGLKFGAMFRNIKLDHDGST